jgi:signal transduction histidine kinase/ActR/RegA family two-component response regulator
LNLNNGVSLKTNSSHLSYVILLSFIILIVLAGLGWFGLSHIEKEIQSNVLSQLTDRLPHSIKMIKIWKRGVKMDVSTIASDKNLQSKIHALIKHAQEVQGDASGIVRSEELKAIRQYLEPIQTNNSFTGFSILNEEGFEIGSLGDEGIGAQRLVNAPEGERLLKFASLGNTFITLPFKSEFSRPGKKGALMLVGSPIYQSTGKFVAVLIFYLQPEAVFTEIFGISRSGKSGETYAFDYKGRLLTKSRFEADLRQVGNLEPSASSILNITIKDPGGNLLEGHQPLLAPDEQPFTRMAQSALKKESGFDIEGYRDYRGVRVVGVWSWLSEFRFGVASEIEYEEAYSLLYEIKKSFYGVFGFLVLAACGVIGLAWRQGQINLALVETTEMARKANLAKSEFLSRMSHELRTPLNAILGFSQLLQMGSEYKQSSDVQSKVDPILKAGNHLLELVDEVLELSKIEEGKLKVSIEPVETFEIKNEVLDLVKPMAEQESVVLIDQCPIENSLFVMADRLRLKQILVNLITNAIKYNKAGGSVTLTQKIENQNLIFRVEDNGPGIKEEDKTLIFKPFERLGAEGSGVEGTGIGLSIAKNLIELMNGSIGFTSEVGKGSCFYFALPLTDKPSNFEEKTDQKPGNFDTSKNIKTVLYIEDNPINLELVEQVLGGEEHIRLIAASNGGLGIQAAREQSPNLILLDINLPDTDGISVFKKLKSFDNTSHIPVIALSADAMESDKKLAMDLGFYSYIAKPIDISNFRRSIDDALSKTS